MGSIPPALVTGMQILTLKCLLFSLCSERWDGARTREGISGNFVQMCATTGQSLMYYSCRSYWNYFFIVHRSGPVNRCNSWLKWLLRGLQSDPRLLFCLLRVAGRNWSLQTPINSMNKYRLYVAMLRKKHWTMSEYNQVPSIDCMNSANTHQSHIHLPFDDCEMKKVCFSQSQLVRFELKNHEY